MLCFGLSLGLCAHALQWKIPCTIPLDLYCKYLYQGGRKCLANQLRQVQCPSLGTGRPSCWGKPHCGQVLDPQGQVHDEARGCWIGAWLQHGANWGEEWQQQPGMLGHAVPIQVQQPKALWRYSTNRLSENVPVKRCLLLSTKYIC